MLLKRKHILLLVAVCCIVFSCLCFAKQPDYQKFLQGDYWREQALNEIIPFWIPTKDDKGGGFFTDIQNDGSIVANPKKYSRMISRLVYGFSVAYSLSGDEKYLQLAQHGLKYLQKYGWDQNYGGWYTELNSQNQPTVRAKNLFDQTYGNLGPIFYYYVTGDQAALDLVQQTHRLLNEKAWDPKYGGYYAMVDEDWNVPYTVKSFNSQIDTATAYLIYYYLATRDNALLKKLQAIGDVACDHMFDPKTASVREMYTQKWKPLDSYLGNQDQIDVGHNLKTAWVLLRIYQLTGKEKYLNYARKIAGRMLATAWDQKNFGWYFTKNVNRCVKNDREKEKCWWTQTEGSFMLLNLYNVTHQQSYLDFFGKNAYFWDKYQVDHQYKEVYGYTSETGKPLPGLKGNLYKSGYHSMENALMNYLYLELYVNRQPATLYFNLSSPVAGNKHYLKIVEDPTIIIKKIEIDHEDWEQFDAKAGWVILPKGKNMKVKVTFQAKK